jgi:hypothetical protein
LELKKIITEIKIIKMDFEELADKLYKKYNKTCIKHLNHTLPFDKYELVGRILLINTVETHQELNIKT